MSDLGRAWSPSPAAPVNHYLSASAKCTIVAPFTHGHRVLLPAGTVVRSTHPTKTYRVLTRAQHVRVYHGSDGYVVRDSTAHAPFIGANTEGTVLPPQVSWAGTGSYWCDAQVTPEVYAANGLAVPDLGFTDAEAEALGFPVLPSLTEGYFARFAGPAQD